MKKIILLLDLFCMLEFALAQTNTDKEVILIKSLRTASDEALAKPDVDGYWCIEGEGMMLFIDKNRNVREEKCFRETCIISKVL